ncbi:MAG: hypothetical protein JNM56_01545 [Planctomycetia bacterium]|nr:hypothetical protein [Planctomycetia bacterium]
MSTSPEPVAPAAEPSPPPAVQRSDYFAALLSYLVPGLGQIYQGRFGKGLMFMVCLLGMFFFGMYLGQWKNVYLPDTDERVPSSPPFSFLPKSGRNAVNRLPFAGQFWIGIAAWPAIMQYNGKPPVAKESSEFWHEFQKTPDEAELNRLQVGSDKNWDLGWVYTVIAGVLNILVIYDAFAGPALAAAPEENPTDPKLQEAVA